MDEKNWVENWKRVGPILEKIEAEELRTKDNAEMIQRLIPMLDWCIKRATPRTTSGLVEQQRLFRKLNNQKEK
jgi:hypothetical protein